MQQRASEVHFHTHTPAVCTCSFIKPDETETRESNAARCLQLALAFGGRLPGLSFRYDHVDE